MSVLHPTVRAVIEPGVDASRHLFGKPLSVSANSLFIDAQNFRRDVAAAATFDRSNCRCGLSLPERLHLFSNHATRLSLGQSTARRKSHESERHHTLGLKS